VRLLDRESLRNPYRRARRLIEWAVSRQALLEGRIILQGGRLEGLTLGEYLSAAYALVVEEFTLGRGGVQHEEIIEGIDSILDKVLPEELTEEGAELLRRREIAEQNRGATERLAGMMRMDQGPRYG